MYFVYRYFCNLSQLSCTHNSVFCLICIVNVTGIPKKQATKVEIASLKRSLKIPLKISLKMFCIKWFFVNDYTLVLVSHLICALIVFCPIVIVPVLLPYCIFICEYGREIFIYAKLQDMQDWHPWVLFTKLLFYWVIVFIYQAIYCLLYNIIKTAWLRMNLLMSLPILLSYFVTNSLLPYSYNLLIFFIMKLSGQLNWYCVVLNVIFFHTGNVLIIFWCMQCILSQFMTIFLILF